MILFGVAIHGQRSAYVDSLPIIAGIAASGFFLMCIAGLGLWGTVKHHQVALFFYMVVLFCLFVIQFSVACACLAVDEQQELYYAEYVSSS